MSAESTNKEADIQSSDVVRAPGEVFWAEGAEGVRPIRIRQGVVAYRRGNIAFGLVGPGQVATPVPGVPLDGPAAAELVALTETVAAEIDPTTARISPQELAVSSRAVIESTDRLGNRSLPQRLAGLLLDITELTGQPMVGCRQDILAMAAAARRETVATILSGWRDQDWIQTRYRRCKVLDRQALERIRDDEE